MTFSAVACPSASCDTLFLSSLSAMAEGARGRRGLVRPRAAAGVPSRDETLSRHQRRQNPVCSAVAVQGKTHQTPSSTSTPRLDGNRTTTTARRTPSTRLYRPRAGAASSCSGSALLLSTAVVLSLLSPAGCLAAARSAAPSPSPLHDNLWDTISGDPDYSKLTECLEMADPSVADLLRAASGSAAGQPLTLFAPKDEAFEQPAWRGGKGGGGKNATIFDDRYSLD